MLTALVITVIFLVIMFPLYHLALRLGTSKQDRFKQSHFDDAMNHKGRHL
jgi:hypothetical protein